MTAMGNDIQRASVWKRFSAYLFDFIILGMVAVGFAFLLSSALGYDAHIAERERLREEFEARYGVDFDITQEDYDALTDEERSSYQTAYEAFVTDPAVNAKDVTIINLTLIITVFGILAAFLIFEFLIPLKLGYGQTLGKKIFGVAVMRVDGVKMSVFQLFVRSILGKYTVETMIPILLVLMFLVGAMPLACVCGICLILLLQVCFLLTSYEHTLIHDKIAGTVAVDMASQLIFDTEEDRIAHEKKRHAEAVERAEYR